jgi:hypothetical protein
MWIRSNHRLPSFDSVLAGIPAPADAAARYELHCLAGERNADFFWTQLLSFGTRRQEAAQEDTAAGVYAAIVNGKSVPAEIARAAQERLEALQGKGPFRTRAETFFVRLARETPDLTDLLAWGLAGTMFQAVRLGSLRLLTANPAARAWTRGVGAMALSSALGLGAEGLTLPFAGRAAKGLLGRPQEWDLETLGRELRSSYAVLGGWRLAGWGATSLQKSLGWSGKLARTLLEPGSLFAGVYCGYGLNRFLGGGNASEGGPDLAGVMATWLHAGIARSLVKGMLGPGFAHWQERIERQAQLATRRSQNSGNRGTWAGTSPTRAEAALPTAGSGMVPREIPSHPNLVFAKSTGTSPPRRGSVHRAVYDAAALREQIAPAAAAERRAARAQQYFETLRALPVKRGIPVKEIQTEAQEAIDLVLTWASRKDGFQRAIAARHYAEAWTIFSKFARYKNIEGETEARVPAQLDKHAFLLAEETNPAMLRALLEATSPLAMILSQIQRSLSPESALGRDFVDKYRQLLDTLATRLATPATTELRKRYLDALGEVLEAARNGDPYAASQILSVLTSLRTWITGTQPQLQKMALPLLPLFWKLLARTASPELGNALLGNGSPFPEEVAYLQRTVNFKTRQPVLESALQAYPWYAETVLHLTHSFAPEVLIMLQALLGQARMLRGWIEMKGNSPASDPICKSYRHLMQRIDDRTYSVMEQEKIPAGFQEARQVLHQELKTEFDLGLQAFRSRITQGGDSERVIAAQYEHSRLYEIHSRGVSSRSRWPKRRLF